LKRNAPVPLDVVYHQVRNAEGANERPESFLELDFDGILVHDDRLRHGLQLSGAHARIRRVEHGIEPRLHRLRVERIPRVELYALAKLEPHRLLVDLRPRLRQPGHQVEIVVQLDKPIEYRLHDLIRASHRRVRVDGSGLARHCDPDDLVLGMSQLRESHRGRGQQ
jgi:hypothetical protein